MCTLRQRDSESPNSALNPLSQTARNVHSETVRLRITKFCSQVSVADCTECALWDRETQNHQITTFASSAHIPFILKGKLKFSLQRRRKFTRTPSQLVTFSAPTYQTFMQGLLKGLTKFFSQISVSDCTKCALWDRETQKKRFPLSKGF